MKKILLGNEAIAYGILAGGANVITSYPGTPASEIVILEGQDGYLSQPLLHFNYRSVIEFHRKQRTREVFEATTLHRQGVRLRPRTFVLQPLREFWRRYVTLKGYQDGLHGLRLSILLAYYFGFRNYVRLGQMRRSGELG